MNILQILCFSYSGQNNDNIKQKDYVLWDRRLSENCLAHKKKRRQINS